MNGVTTASELCFVKSMQIGLGVTNKFRVRFRFRFRNKIRVKHRVGSRDKVKMRVMKGDYPEAIVAVACVVPPFI